MLLCWSGRDWQPTERCQDFLGSFMSSLEKRRPEHTMFFSCSLKRGKVHVQIYSLLDLGQEAEPKSTCGDKRGSDEFPFVFAVLFFSLRNVR